VVLASRFGSSCANCYYNSKGIRCSFRLSKLKYTLRKLQGFYKFCYIRTCKELITIYFKEFWLTSAFVAPPFAPLATLAAALLALAAAAALAAALALLLSPSTFIALFVVSSLLPFITTNSLQKLVLCLATLMLLTLITLL
jgi:hypothetical protein